MNVIHTYEGKSNITCTFVVKSIYVDRFSKKKNIAINDNIRGTK